MLNKYNTALVIIDIQGRLAEIVHEKEQLAANVIRLIKGAKLFELPILWVEQYPEGLGKTTPEIAEHLAGLEVIEKISFSAYQNTAFLEMLKEANCKQLLVVGIETHVCVYQTVSDLLSNDYEVHLVVDAVSSRTEKNKLIGIEKMKDNGAQITSTEMALFELMQEAKGDEWKELLKIVK